MSSLTFDATLIPRKIFTSKAHLSHWTVDKIFEAVLSAGRVVVQFKVAFAVEVVF